MRGPVVFVSDETELVSFLATLGLKKGDVLLAHTPSDIELVDISGRLWIVQPGFNERDDLEEWQAALAPQVERLRRALVEEP